MLGSPNLRRRNAPLAPLDRYGLPGLSSATTDGVLALARGFQGAMRSALCCGKAQVASQS
jgi:hypothetical protein